MKIFTWANVLVFGCAFIQYGIATHATAQDTPEADVPYQELMRGPIHEAFAEQVSLDPQPGEIVPQAPPQPVRELPPEIKPADANAVWVDGYWAWEDTENRFIWISGLWRIAPRGYRWAAGHWLKVEGGYQWVGGFWSPAEREDVAYQPPPPESLEDGPTSPSPGVEYLWTPGCWYYRDASYVWRPGFWITGSNDWVWIPHYYRWTPRGCLLVGGYWDLPPVSRGCLFAPVFFNEPAYLADRWYTPSVLLDISALHLHLFVRPSNCHYYFGDYYGDDFVRQGWYPWYAYHQRRHCYDPWYAFNDCNYRRHGIDFGGRIRGWHDYFDDHRDERPKHTLGQQQRWNDDHRDFKYAKQTVLGDSFERHARDRQNQFVKLSDGARRSFSEQGRSTSKFREERSKFEIARDVAENRGGVTQGDGRKSLADRDLPRLKLPTATERAEEFRGRLGSSLSDSNSRFRQQSEDNGGNRVFRSNYDDDAPTRPRAIISGGSDAEFRGPQREQFQNLRDLGSRNEGSVDPRFGDGRGTEVRQRTSVAETKTPSWASRGNFSQNEGSRTGPPSISNSDVRPRLQLDTPRSSSPSEQSNRSPTIDRSESSFRSRSNERSIAPGSSSGPSRLPSREFSSRSNGGSSTQGFSSQSGRSSSSGFSSGSSQSGRSSGSRGGSRGDSGGKGRGR